MNTRRGGYWTRLHIKRRKTGVFVLTDEIGTKLADYGRGLGHSNLKTTSDYSRDIEDEFGI
jgi:hypothetical protein